MRFTIMSSWYPIWYDELFRTRKIATSKSVFIYKQRLRWTYRLSTTAAPRANWDDIFFPRPIIIQSTIIDTEESRLKGRATGLFCRSITAGSKTSTLRPRYSDCVVMSYWLDLRATSKRILAEVSTRDGHFRISNPRNIGSESGSFIGLLSPKIFLAIIHCCVIVVAYFSMWSPVVI